MFSANVNFAGLLRLSAVAITPAILIGTGLGLANINFPFENWAFFGLEMLFLLMAVSANKSGNAPPPSGFPMASYPPGYGATAGGYPQQQGYAAPPPPMPPGNYPYPPQQHPPGPPPIR